MKNKELECLLSEFKKVVAQVSSTTKEMGKTATLRLLLEQFHFVGSQFLRNASQKQEIQIYFNSQLNAIDPPLKAMPFVLKLNSNSYNLDEVPIEALDLQKVEIVIGKLRTILITMEKEVRQIPALIQLISDCQVRLAYCFLVYSFIQVQQHITLVPTDVNALKEAEAYLILALKYDSTNITAHYVSCQLEISRSRLLPPKLAVEKLCGLLDKYQSYGKLNKKFRLLIGGIYAELAIVSLDANSWEHAMLLGNLRPSLIYRYAVAINDDTYKAIAIAKLHLHQGASVLDKLESYAIMNCTNISDEVEQLILEYGKRDNKKFQPKKLTKKYSKITRIEYPNNKTPWIGICTDEKLDVGEKSEILEFVPKGYPIRFKSGIKTPRTENDKSHGCSCHGFYGGTLGFCFYDTTTNSHYGVTCRHVLAEGEGDDGKFKKNSDLVDPPFCKANDFVYFDDIAKRYPDIAAVVRSDHAHGTYFHHNFLHCKLENDQADSDSVTSDYSSSADGKDLPGGIYDRKSETELSTLDTDKGEGNMKSSNDYTEKADLLDSEISFKKNGEGKSEEDNGKKVDELSDEILKIQVKIQDNNFDVKKDDIHSKNSDECSNSDDENYELPYFHTFCSNDSTNLDISSKDDSIKSNGGTQLGSTYSVDSLLSDMPKIGDIVVKLGSKTGFTVGSWDGYDYVTDGFYHIVKWLNDDSPFAMHGDSGSLVLYYNKEKLAFEPLGIHCKSDRDLKCSFATPIAPCLKRLKKLLLKEDKKENDNLNRFKVCFPDGRFLNPHFLPVQCCDAPSKSPFI